MADTSYNQQLQAMHQLALQGKLKTGTPAAANLSAQLNPKAPKPPVAPSAPSVDVVSPKTAKAMAPVAKAPVAPPPPAPIAPAPPFLTPSPAPAATGASQTSPTAPSAPDYQTQVKAAQDAYIASLAPSPEAAVTQEQLGALKTQSAADVASAQQQYADRLKAVQEQATLQPFLTGREQQAQQQLTSQLAAIQAGSQAQTIPLQERLAQYQAQQQALQQQKQAALGFAQPKTESVAPGQTVINPLTGQVVYSAPEKPITVAAGTQLVDPNTGKIISSTPSKPISLTATGTLIDPTTGKIIAQGAGASLGGMSQGAIDTAAQQYLLTGQMPTLGIGGATAKVAILNKAADLAAASGQDAQSLALQKAAFKSGQSELTKLMGQQGPVMAFENTAKANLDQALNLSNQVDRSGSPVVNRWLLKVKGQYAGDPQVASFEAATETAANEYAKVVSSATGGGVTTDSARNQAMGLLNTAQTPDQFASVVNQLKVEMENRRKGMEQEIQSIQQQMLGSQDQTSGADNSSAGGFNW